jgi:hypothetical protein
MRAARQDISPSGNLGDLDNNYMAFPRNVRFTVTCDGVDQFTKAARLAARDGVDTIKVNVSGDRLSRSLSTPTLAAELIRR